MSNAGLGHDPQMGGVPTCNSKNAKKGADDFSDGKLYWGEDFDGCPRSDDAPRRLDVLLNEILCLAECSGVNYDPCRVDNLKRMIEATGSDDQTAVEVNACLLYTSPSPRDLSTSRMPSSA